mmetsp:Transcript_61538/g.129871  ORF Transcript_61538/g.129871 Transcript_61538/m.129871 type:complete len:221 (+) Transcript_61538:65-727(+)
MHLSYTRDSNADGLLAPEHFNASLALAYLSLTSNIPPSHTPQNAPMRIIYPSRPTSLCAHTHTPKRPQSSNVDHFFLAHTPIHPHKHTQTNTHAQTNTPTHQQTNKQTNPQQTHKNMVSSLMSMVRLLVVASIFALGEHIAAAFSPESCTEMFASMKKLGGTVPPADHVAGCTEVCAKVKELKEYWGSKTDMAKYACEQGKTYGCVWAGTPPVTMSDIGC